MRFRAFRERVGPRILSVESLDYFGTSEHFSGRKTRENLNWQNFHGEANCSGVVNFHCMQMSQQKKVFGREEKRT